ncbi:MAG: NosD domain-containing protein [Fibrobacterota bacterium]
MIDRSNPYNIWVSPQGDISPDGSRQHPYSSVNEALLHASPGTNIVLQSGTYDSTVTLQEVQGSLEIPIRILGDTQEGPVICRGTWYMYSVQNIILSDILFQDTKDPAISLVGESYTNIFKNITFRDCGGQAECSFFLGGSQGRDNIIENCTFIQTDSAPRHVGVLFSQSIDLEDETLLVSKNNCVRFSAFTNFKTAVIAGSGDDIRDYSDFRIEHTLFTSCSEGVRIKANGTTLAGNIFRRCFRAVIHAGGMSTTVKDNRFDQCAAAVSCEYGDCMVHENCLIDSGVSVKDEVCSSPNIFHHNTFYFSESELLLDGSSNEICGTVFMENLFYNARVKHSDSFEFTNNIANTESEYAEKTDIVFERQEEGVLVTNSPWGCSTKAASQQKIDVPEKLNLAHVAEVHGFSPDDLAGSVEKRELFMQTLYPSLENSEEEDDENSE